jgi:hypothetical protein
VDHGPYQDWRDRLDAWLSGQAPALTSPEVKDRILAVLDQARLAVRGINATLDQVEVKDLNKYEFLASRLDDLLGFEEFSLAEYTYVLGGGKKPGIRLLVRQGDLGTRISILLFEDVVQWRVDHEGRKISAELMSLDLSGPELEAIWPESARDLFPAQADWRGRLTEALSLPVLWHHEPSG